MLSSERSTARLPADASLRGLPRTYTYRQRANALPCRRFSAVWRTVSPGRRKRPVRLKSAQSGFESDWGTGYHLVDPLYGASRSVDDFLVAA